MSNFRQNESEFFSFCGAERVNAAAGAGDSTGAGVGVTVGITDAPAADDPMGAGVGGADGPAAVDPTGAGFTVRTGVGVSPGANSFDLVAEGGRFRAFGCRACRFLGAEFSFSCASG